CAINWAYYLDYW
nr:immunoglobulin heavy chain junction region [Mus musculus]